MVIDIDKLISFLVDWVEKYVRNKDLVNKALREITHSYDEIDAKFEHKEHKFIIIPDIDDVNAVLKRLSQVKDKHLTLITLNSQSNLDLLIKYWHEFVDLGQKFSIFFINPFSKTDRVWIIYPYIHQRIADEESLALGLRAMFEVVEPITANEANRIVA